MAIVIISDISTDYVSNITTVTGSTSHGTFVVEGLVPVKVLEDFIQVITTSTSITCGNYFFSKGSINLLPARPSTAHKWSWRNLDWYVEVEKYAQVRLELLHLRRETAEFGNFTYNGMEFDGDLNAQRRLSGVVSAAKTALAAGFPFTKDFTLANNSVVSLTAEDFIGIEMAKIWQVDVAFQDYRLKKSAIEAATTIAELDAIVI